MNLIDIVPPMTTQPTQSQAESLLYAREFAVMDYMSKLEDAYDKDEDLADDIISRTYQDKLNLINMVLVLCKVGFALSECVKDYLVELPDDHILTDHEMVMMTLALKLGELTGDLDEQQR